MYLVELYVTNATLKVNNTFTYYSDFYIEKYTRVLINFARKENIGFVVNCIKTDKKIEEINAEKGFKLNKIIEVIDDKPILNEDQYNLANWLSYTTISPFVSCLNAMLPKQFRTIKNFKDIKKKRVVYKNELNIDLLTPKQKEIYLKINNGDDYTIINKYSPSIIKKLIDNKYIYLKDEEVTFKNKQIEYKNFKELTPDQENVYNKFLNSDKLISLLYGVTGSGKTEVYLHLARHYLKENKQVLILVPEISLTPQMISRVKEHFNDVIFFHSELNDQEKYEQYKRVIENKVKIVVGTRSSVFLPFNNLGLIIIDEEHDQSYKQDSTPCYNTINVAIKRCNDFNAKLLLASATPNLQSFNLALNGTFNFLKLEKRINNCLPNINIVNIQNKLSKGKSFIISDELKNSLQKCLDDHHQAIILLNRRGYSTVIKCGDCGETIMCKNCDNSLIYHNNLNLLKCHKCGYTHSMYYRCPSCNSTNLIKYGFGTLKVEEELTNLFPGIRVVRMDRDSTTRKGSKESILNSFGNKEYDVLLGTQMISKGLDYENVTLVGVINGDQGLFHQDYNSSKITFDLLMQSLGRSGRGSNSGEVVIQVFNSDNYVIKSIVNQSYNDFYNNEIKYRKVAHYPPFSHILEISVSDLNDKKANESIEYLEKLINSYNLKYYPAINLGKINNVYRYHILVQDNDINKLLKIAHEILNKYLTYNYSRLTFNVDPTYIE